MKKTLFLTALVALGLGAAQSSDIVGYVTRTIPNGSTNLVAINFEQPPSSAFNGTTAGTIEGVANTTLTDNEGGWDANFATATQPYFVKMSSGAAEGRFFQIATTNNATSLNLAGADQENPVAAGVSIGDSYEILAGKTLVTFFATTNVTTGASAGVADNVLLLNNGTWQTHYNNGSSWRSGPSNTNNTIVRPDAGLFYLRRSGGALTLLTDGVVPTEDQEMPVRNASTSLLNINFPTNMTLAESNLQNMPGWVAAGNVTAADNLLILTNGTWQTNYHNGSNWRSGPSNTNNTIVPPGSAVFINKKSGTAGTKSIYNRTSPIP